MPIKWTDRNPAPFAPLAIERNNGALYVREVSEKMMNEPVSDQQWAEAAALAQACVNIDAAREWGCIDEKGRINNGRCYKLLAAAAEKGLRPDPACVGAAMAALALGFDPEARYLGKNPPPRRPAPAPPPPPPPNTTDKPPAAHFLIARCWSCGEHVKPIAGRVAEGWEHYCCDFCSRSFFVRGCG